MDYSKINRYKTPIIIGSFALAFLVAVVSFFYGIKTAPKDNPMPANANVVETATAPAEVDLKIKGNRKSKIYHMRGCPNYADLKDSNIVWFRTKDEAVSAGYRMARNC